MIMIHISRIQDQNQIEAFVLLKELENNSLEVNDLKLQTLLRLLCDFYRLNWKVRYSTEGLHLVKDENIKNENKSQ